MELETIARTEARRSGRPGQARRRRAGLTYDEVRQRIDDNGASLKRGSVDPRLEITC